MASGDGATSSSAGGGLPALSRTYQASQLLTPSWLQRITIDQPHYHGHLSSSLAAQGPSNPLQRRTQKMGDKHFHLLKDIPVEQNYARTDLKLSEVRPWDQVVARPLCTGQVIAKEVDLPFPQEHPYTSHISRFSVFPDTKPHPPPILPRQPPPPTGATTTDASTQTPTREAPKERGGFPLSYASSGGGDATSYYVPRKASEMGVRVERRHLSAPPTRREGDTVDRPRTAQIWDLPRSRQLQRCKTYPAPALQFGPAPPPPPSTTFTPSPLSPASHQALEAIHKRLARTSAYSEHYPPPPPPPLHATATSSRAHTGTSRAVSGRLYCRPWTTESRGKYSKGVPIPGSKYPYIPDFDSSTTESDIVEKEKLLDSVGLETGTSVPPNDTSISDTRDSELRGKVDNSTQTEDDLFTVLPPSTPSPPHHPHTSAGDELPSLMRRETSANGDRQLKKITRRSNSAVLYDTTYTNTYTLPQLAPDGKPPTGNSGPPAVARRPVSANEASALENKDVPLPRQRRHTTQFTALTPPTTRRTRHMMGLLNGFTRVAVLGQFHSEHPEGAPDLRGGGGVTKEGRRHVFSGHHAYDFH